MNLTWRLLAPVYDRYAAQIEPTRQNIISAAGVGPDDRVLLAGCGTGLTLRALPPTADVVAVDHSPAMVGRTRRRGSDLGVVVDARVGDVTALDLGDGAVDVVCLHLVLSVVDRPETAVREAARVLRSAGRLSVIADTDGVPDLPVLFGKADLAITDRSAAPPGCLALVGTPRETRV